MAQYKNFPNFEKEFCLETVISLFKLRDVLRQSQEDSVNVNRFPVAWYSRLISKAERNCGITDHIGLAVLWV